VVEKAGQRPGNAREDKTVLMAPQLLEAGCDWGKVKIQTRGLRRVS